MQPTGTGTPQPTLQKIEVVDKYDPDFMWFDFELGQEPELTHYEWITDTSIYGTTSWVKYGEGPTGLKMGNAGDPNNNEAELNYTSKDIRFTVKGDVLYAIILAWPEQDVLIRSLVPAETDMAKAENQINYPGYYLYPDEIKSISMLGDGAELNWEMVEGVGLKITPPDKKPCEHAFVFRIERKPIRIVSTP
jgi:alpha-L-fucosidase